MSGLTNYIFRSMPSEGSQLPLGSKLRKEPKVQHFLHVLNTTQYVQSPQVEKAAKAVHTVNFATLAGLSEDAILLMCCGEDRYEKVKGRHHFDHSQCYAVWMPKAKTIEHLPGFGPPAKESRESRPIFVDNHAINVDFLESLTTEQANAFIEGYLIHSIAEDILDEIHRRRFYSTEKSQRDIGLDASPQKRKRSHHKTTKSDKGSQKEKQRAYMEQQEDLIIDEIRDAKEKSATKKIEKAIETERKLAKKDHTGDRAMQDKQDAEDLEHQIRRSQSL